MKVTKEEQPFWDQVFLVTLTRLLGVEGNTLMQVIGEAEICADVALAARRARSQ